MKSLDSSSKSSPGWHTPPRQREEPRTPSPCGTQKSEWKGRRQWLAEEWPVGTSVGTCVLEAMATRNLRIHVHLQSSRTSGLSHGIWACIPG